MKDETIKVVIGGSIQELPVRHGFACYPPDRTPVDIIDFGKDFRLRLTEHLYFNGVLLCPGWHIIPCGAKCDSISTGRGAGRALLGRGKNGRAGIIHDWLYSLDGPEGITRKQADDIFYAVMRYSGTPAWRARMGWLAVRCFGAKYYKTERMGGVTSQ